MASDLERAAERFADTVHADVSAQVKLAWALERDRLYAELAELRDEVHALATLVLNLTASMKARGFEVVAADSLHSVKVPDHATTPVERGRYEQ